MPTPQTGTWRIKINAVRSKSFAPQAGMSYDEYTCPGPVFGFNNFPATDAQIVAASKTPGDGKIIDHTFSANMFIKYDNETNITLNAGTVDEETIPIVSLPAGWKVVLGNVVARAKSDIAPSLGGWTVSLSQDLQTLLPTVVHADMQFALCPLTTTTFSRAITAVTQDLLTIRILTGFGPEWRLDFVSGNSFQINWDYIALEGTYEILANTFTITPPNRTVQPGDTITVTSNPLDPLAMNFTQIQTLNIITLDKNLVQIGAPIPIPSSLWTTVTNNLWIFTLPAFLSNGIPNFIRLQVTSTQFSGTVNLITMYPIYFFNAPGIYQLIPGQLHDIYYNRLTTPISTVNTKIPNPFGKTGFF